MVFIAMIFPIIRKNIALYQFLSFQIRISLLPLFNKIVSKMNMLFYAVIIAVCANFAGGLHLMSHGIKSESQLYFDQVPENGQNLF